MNEIQITSPAGKVAAFAALGAVVAGVVYVVRSREREARALEPDMTPEPGPGPRYRVVHGGRYVLTLRPQDHIVISDDPNFSPTPFEVSDIEEKVTRDGAWRLLGSGIGEPWWSRLLALPIRRFNIHLEIQRLGPNDPSFIFPNDVAGSVASLERRPTKGPGSEPVPVPSLANHGLQVLRERAATRGPDWLAWSPYLAVGTGVLVLGAGSLMHEQGRKKLVLT